MTKKLQVACKFLLITALIAIGLSYLYRNHQTVPSDLTFKIIDGRQLSLEKYRGKLVLIDFWSTNCASCIKELPDLIALYNEFSLEGFEIIGVAMPYDRPDLILQSAEKHKIPYPVSLDLDGEITQAFGGVQFTPTHFLIAPDGKIVDHIIGTIDPVKLRDKIKSLLPHQPLVQL
ncbi:MAG: TlpA family protein disulfide reductase [Gammaproteobacteria bacterium]